MGASGWKYFVPYQPDLNKALHDLHQKVFEANAYHFPLEVHFTVEEYQSMSEEALTAKIEELRKAQRRPQSIDELLRMNGETGTHSIIDIESVSDTPDFGKVAPLSQQQLLRLFNTDSPTHTMIEARVDDLYTLRRRWQGTYIIVYKDHQPDEIFFIGYSGD